MYLFLLSSCVNRCSDLQLHSQIPERMCKEDKGGKSFPLSFPEHVTPCPNPPGVHSTYPAALQYLQLSPGKRFLFSEVCEQSCCRASQHCYHPFSSSPWHFALTKGRGTMWAWLVPAGQDDCFSVSNILGWETRMFLWNQSSENLWWTFRNRKAKTELV